MSNFSHYGCNGHLVEVFGTHGWQVFKCNKCGKKFTDKGDGIIVRQREE